MRQDLPERRLLVRAGGCVLTLDLTQIRDVGGAVTPTMLRLAHALGLDTREPGTTALSVETGVQPVTVVVDAVGGVVEVPRVHFHALLPHVLLSRPLLLRGVLRVPEPSHWRGASLLPAPAPPTLDAGLAQGELLAVDLDPVDLGALLLSWMKQPRMGNTL